MKCVFAAPLVALSLAILVPSASSAQLNLSNQFPGNWCAQGDSARPESITSKGPLSLGFRNWAGATATGTLVGLNSHEVVVAKWKGVHGNLSGDAQTINWSNGTFWKRCSATVTR
jgi:hypothetical protein